MWKQLYAFNCCRMQGGNLKTRGEEGGKKAKKTVLVKEESEYKNITTTMHY